MQQPAVSPQSATPIVKITYMPSDNEWVSRCPQRLERLGYKCDRGEDRRRVADQLGAFHGVPGGKFG